MEESKTVGTVNEMLNVQIKETLDDLELARFSSDENIKPVLDKLKILHTQQLEIQKLEQQAADKRQELELELRKIESETAIKIRELELKEREAKNNQANEEQKLREQKKSNIANAVIGGVTAATGVAGILATLHCFKRSMIFEETGSYTNKTGQAVGSLFNLFRRKG